MIPSFGIESRFDLAMHVAALVLLLTGVYPLGRALWNNRHTTLVQSLHWAVAAWLAWTGTAFFAVWGAESARLPVLRYVALCLTGCAGVAVLGARRPGVQAWNLVVLCLLAVMLLPLLENLLPGAPLLDTVRLVFLAGTLSVGIVNYLPTRLAAAMGVLSLACIYEVLTLVHPAQWDSSGVVGGLLLGLVPWVGYLAWRSATVPANEFQRLWWDFRNRYGLFWSQRVREQFNNAAHHAGWPVRLFWQGLVLTHALAPPEEDAPKEMVTTLRALLRRFTDEDVPVR